MAHEIIVRVVPDKVTKGGKLVLKGENGQFVEGRAVTSLITQAWIAADLVAADGAPTRYKVTFEPITG